MSAPRTCSRIALKRPSRRPTRMLSRSTPNSDTRLQPSSTQSRPPPGPGARIGRRQRPRVRAAEAGRHAVDLHDGAALEAGTRAVDHLDALQILPLAAQIDRLVLALADQPVDGEVLREAVHVDEPHRHQVDVAALGDQVQPPEPAVPAPVFRVADVDDVAVDPEADRPLAEQHPLARSPPDRRPCLCPCPSAARRASRASAPASTSAAASADNLLQGIAKSPIVW